MAATGTFRGNADFGGASTPLHSDEAAGDDDLDDTFVVMYDANGVAQWATSFGGAGAQRATGIAATPDNDVVVQGSWTDPSDAAAPRAFVARYRGYGPIMWWLAFGKEATSVVPSQLRVDNDGVLWAAGSFTGELRVGDSAVNATEQSGYLMSLVPKGLPQLQLVVTDGWHSSSVNRLVVDDEDNIAFVGLGEDADGREKTFFRKISRQTGIVFEKQFQGTKLFAVLGLAVDRKMRLTLSGTFDHTFTNEGQTFTTEPAETDLWLAQYSREGELNWQKQVHGSSQPSAVYASVADRFDNLLFAGYGRELTIDGEAVPSTDMAYLFFFKLRPDGTKLWARITNDLGWPNTMTTNGAGEIWLGSRTAVLSQLSP